MEQVPTADGGAQEGSGGRSPLAPLPGIDEAPSLPQSTEAQLIAKQVQGLFKEPQSFRVPADFS